MRRGRSYPEYLDSAQKIIKNDKRHAALIWHTKAAERFAKENDLEIASSDKLGACIIGKKAIVRDLISDEDLAIPMPEVATKAKQLYEAIKDSRVVDALKFMLERPSGRPFVEPEVALLEGVFYGYSLCDIEYYIRTRYFREPEHPYEHQVMEKFDHVLCEKCAKEKISQD